MSLISTYSEIQNLRFEKFPTRPTGIKKIIRIDSFILAVSNTGIIYTNSKLISNYAWGMSYNPNKHWIGRILLGLVKLGVIDKKIYDGHCEFCRKNSAMTDAEYDLDHIEKVLNEYGVSLSDEQRQKIEVVKETGEKIS